MRDALPQEKRRDESLPQSVGSLALEVNAGDPDFYPQASEEGTPDVLVSFF